MCVQLYASASVQPFIFYTCVDQLPDMPVDLRRADVALPTTAEQMNDAVLVVRCQQRKIAEAIQKVIAEFVQYWPLLIVALENERHEHDGCQHNCTGKDKVEDIHMASFYMQLSAKQNRMHMMINRMVLSTFLMLRGLSLV